MFSNQSNQNSINNNINFQENIPRNFTYPLIQLPNGDKYEG